LRMMTDERRKTRRTVQCIVRLLAHANSNDTDTDPHDPDLARSIHIDVREHRSKAAKGRYEMDR
jgi:hypothetical protein